MKIFHHFAVVFTGCLFVSGLTAGCTHSLPGSSSPVPENGTAANTADIEISSGAEIRIASPQNGYALSRTFAYMKASADVRALYECRMAEKVREVLLVLGGGKKPDPSDGTAVLIAETAEEIYRARAAAGGKPISSFSAFLKESVVDSPAFPDDCAGFAALFMPGLRTDSIREENNTIFVHAVFSPEQYRQAKRIIGRVRNGGTVENFAVKEKYLPPEPAAAACCFGWRIKTDPDGEPFLLSFGHGAAASASATSQSNASVKAKLDSQNEQRKAMADLIVSASAETLLRERRIPDTDAAFLAGRIGALRKKCGTLKIRGCRELETRGLRLSSSEIIIIQASGMKPHDIMSALLPE